MMVLIAAVALSFLGTASASANWFIGGEELKTSAALSATAAVDQSPTFLVPALGVTIECSGSFNHWELGGISHNITRYLSVFRIRLLGCSITHPLSGCKTQPANQTIDTLAVNGSPFLTKPTQDSLLISPQTKNTLAEIEFNEENTCALAGLEPLKGELTVGMPTGQTEEVAQAIVGLGSVENNSLEIGAGNKTYLIGGKILLTLASGSKWSFR